MAIDRRVRRTRTALFDALVRLVRQKDYDAISVDDILAEADVGRSTFYAHFASKDDLLAKSLERLREELALRVAAGKEAGAAPHAIARDVSHGLFAHVGQFRDVPLSLAGGRGASIVSAALGRVLMATVRDLPLAAPAGLPRELAVEFVVASFTTVLRWWLERHPEWSAEQADAAFLRLVSWGLAEKATGEGNFGMSNHVP